MLLRGGYRSLADGVGHGGCRCCSGDVHCHNGKFYTNKGRRRRRSCRDRPPRSAGAGRVNRLLFGSDLMGGQTDCCDPRHGTPRRPSGKIGSAPDCHRTSVHLQFSGFSQSGKEDSDCSCTEFCRRAGYSQGRTANRQRTIHQISTRLKSSELKHPTCSPSTRHGCRVTAAIMAQSNFTEAGKKAKSNAHGHKRFRTRVCGLADENIEQENR